MHAPTRPLLCAAAIDNRGARGALAIGTLLVASVALAAPPAPPAPKAKADAAKAADPAPTPVAVPAATLDASRGKEVGLVTEAYLSPHQEGGEEEDTPSSTPVQFRSKGVSQSRYAREAAGHRGHGQLRFSRDFSRAFVDVRIEGVKPSTVNMFHIHCGKPGILGPILVDFSLATDLQSNLADGLFTVEIRNEHITKTTDHDHGAVAAFTMGCVIPSATLGSLTPVKVTTVAGMARLAMDGELYFNLHTTNQTYFGDMRGQIYPVSRP